MAINSMAWMGTCALLLALAAGCSQNDGASAPGQAGASGTASGSGGKGGQAGAGRSGASGQAGKATQAGAGGGGAGGAGDGGAGGSAGQSGSGQAGSAQAGNGGSGGSGGSAGSGGQGGSAQAGSGGSAQAGSGGQGGSAQAGGGQAGAATGGAAGGGQAGAPPAGDRVLTFTNKCGHEVWVGALNSQPKYELPGGGGWKLAPGQSHSIGLPEEWGGRFWGRTGCSFDASGKGSCQTGDCGGDAACGGKGGKPPATLVEFQFAGFGGKDFYDVSLVDGYNLPLSVGPTPGTFTPSGGPYDCGTPACTGDLNATCPPELQQKDDAGKVVACRSACEALKQDPYCCTGAFDKPETCPPTAYSQTFKQACPTAYSYAYDDPSSTFTCVGRDYDIVFCP